MPQLRPTQALAIAAAIIVCFLNFLRAATTCAWDTSYCAASQAKNGYYSGVIAAPAPVANAHLSVGLESLHGEVDGLKTDSTGRYCFVWARESIYPSVRLGQRTITQHDDWVRGPAPPSCQQLDAAVPWNRADGVTHNWRVITIYLLAVLGLVCLIVHRRRVQTIGMVLTGGALLVWILVWA